MRNRANLAFAIALLSLALPHSAEQQPVQPVRGATGSRLVAAPLPLGAMRSRGIDEVWRHDLGARLSGNLSVAELEGRAVMLVPTADGVVHVWR
jgi:hypothetical protein